MGDFLLENRRISLFNFSLKLYIIRIICYNIGNMRERGNTDIMERQKIIFLDIDGVLNGLTRLNKLGFRVASKLGLAKQYKLWTKPHGVHESKVKVLSNIVKDTNAKVVMSSTWRGIYWTTPYEKKEGNVKELTDLLNKYNIQVIGITPSSKTGNRSEEIIKWLKRHKDEVGSYLIIDDEKSDLGCFVEDRLVQTVTPKGDHGLTKKYLKKSIQILNNPVYNIDEEITKLENRNKFFEEMKEIKDSDNPRIKKDELYKTKEEIEEETVTDYIERAIELMGLIENGEAIELDWKKFWSEIPEYYYDKVYDRYNDITAPEEEISENETEDVGEDNNIDER